MRKKRYTYLGHTVTAHENPFLGRDGWPWTVECETCSIPLAIAQMIVCMAQHGFTHVIVDGQLIEEI